MIHSQNLKPAVNRFELLEVCDHCKAVYTVRGEMYPDGVTIEIHDHTCQAEPDNPA